METESPIGIRRPFHRIWRMPTARSGGAADPYQLIQNTYYAGNVSRYFNAFILLTKDLRDLYQYIEPDDQNNDTYSHRLQQLLVRASIEVEANLKAILIANKYESGRSNYDGSMKLDMKDYQLVNGSHRLSSYEVGIADWQGEGIVRQPFKVWSSDPKGTPQWYSAYNAVKHDRVDSFHRATLFNATEAIAGLAVLIAAQFYRFDPTPSPPVLGLGIQNSEGPLARMEFIAGAYFQVRFPTDWEENENYDFNFQEWDELVAMGDPFADYKYPAPPKRR